MLIIDTNSNSNSNSNSLSFGGDTRYHGLLFLVSWFAWLLLVACLLAYLIALSVFLRAYLHAVLLTLLYSALPYSALLERAMDPRGEAVRDTSIAGDFSRAKK